MTPEFLAAVCRLHWSVPPVPPPVTYGGVQHVWTVNGEPRFTVPRWVSSLGKFWRSSLKEAEYRGPRTVNPKHIQRAVHVG